MKTAGQQHYFSIISITSIYQMKDTDAKRNNIFQGQYKKISVEKK